VLVFIQKLPNSPGSPIIMHMLQMKHLIHRHFMSSLKQNFFTVRCIIWF